jgi:hypothetical protein
VSEQVERLRRHVLAIAALNRELHARLGASATRSSTAEGWLEQLMPGAGGFDVRIARGNNATYVIEGDTRRRISSRLVTSALSDALGPVQWVTDEELSALEDGPPVEVLEGQFGPPFVIVGGRRLPIRGMPLPFPVDHQEAQQFPLGVELNIARSNVPRARARYQVHRVRAAVVRRGGVVPAARAAADLVGRKARRFGTRFTR